MIKRDGPTAVANAAASLTALEEINLRLAAIVPEQFVTPSLERDRDRCTEKGLERSLLGRPQDYFLQRPGQGFQRHQGNENRG